MVRTGRLRRGGRGGGSPTEAHGTRGKEGKEDQDWGS